MFESTQNVPNGDFISREAAIEALRSELQFKPDGFFDNGLNQYDIESVLNALPAADVRDNVRGHWVGIDDEPCEEYECDVCGRIYDSCGYTCDLPIFCPNRGADMREVTE